jgi:hypothetical protein
MQCATDLLVDDFAQIDIHDYQGSPRYFNKLGGDYGEVGILAEYSTTERHVALTPVQAKNFWFSKFDLEACFDLSRFAAIQFEIEAPQGTSGSFTLTQKSADCAERLTDSSYVPLSKYVRPNGRRQVVTIPLSDFSTNLDGKPFDFKHLKDWTLNDLQPEGVTINISNLVLKGSCNLQSNIYSNSEPLYSSAASLFSWSGLIASFALFLL